MSAAWAKGEGRKDWTFLVLVVKPGFSGLALEGGEVSGKPTWHLFAVWKIENFKWREKSAGGKDPIRSESGEN